MINKKVERSDKALFELNGKPSWGLAFPQAMQHVLAMLVGNITPPNINCATTGSARK